MKTILAIIAFILFWSIPFLFSGFRQPSKPSEKLIPSDMFTENQMRSRIDDFYENIAIMENLRRSQ